MLLAFLLLTAQVPGSIDLDPRLSWYTIETDHFSVHFSCRGQPNSSELDLAEEVADIAEEVHATLAPATGWTPAERTQIVIADFYDYSNGWAAPFPKNTITVIPTPPAGNRTNEGDWLRTLILHEYSHILQIDQVAGIPAALRHVFGRVIMPNALAPAWLNEGYAVFNETRFTPFGRLRSAEYEMMARAAADSKRLLPVDRCGNYELRRFPGGSAPYLYGSWLHAHLAATDSGVWDRYNRTRSAGFPFFENRHAQRVLGRNIYRAWDETRSGLIASAKRTSQRPQTQPVTQLRQLTADGFWTGSPLWSRYGTRIYYISATGQEYPSIRMLDTIASRTAVLHRGQIFGNLSLSPDGERLAFAELNVAGNFYEYSDIFTFNLTDGSVRQLTYGERARDPDFAPDTSLLVFVGNGAGQNSLRLLDIEKGEVTVLAETDDRTAYHGPRFSPSGKWIAVGVGRPDGCADIELVDRLTGWTFPVTHDRANDISPAWSRTGKYLYFVSDRSGVFNLYVFQLATGKVFAATNVEYGVFEPAISPDNRMIAVTSYSASGCDISTMALRSADWQPVSDATEERTTPPSSPLPPFSQPRQLYYYSPFPSLLPAFWLPWAALSDGVKLQEVGAFTLGWDALQFHQYRLMAGYRFSDSSPFLSVAYTLRRYRPVLSTALDLDLDEQAASINAELPFRATRHANWLDLGISAARDPVVTARADVDWTFSNAHQYRFCVAPVEGRVMGIHADGQSKTLLSDKDRTRLLGYWVQYVGNPPQTWSLRSKLVLGTAFNEAAPGAYQLQVEPELLGVRGYAEPSAEAGNVLAAGLQFRAPLWWVERGIGTGPLFLQNINAAGFADFGTVWDTLPIKDSLLKANTRVGVGAELRTDLIVSHLLPVSLSVGCGFGVNPFWSYRLYFSLSSSMLEGILKSPAVRAGYLASSLRHLPEAR